MKNERGFSLIVLVITIIALLILFCSTTFGQSSYWGTVPNFESTMTLYGTIQINGENATSTDLDIAAFCGDELRGTTKPIKYGNQYIVIFTIGGEEVYEKIGFKLYDPATEKVYSTESTSTITFMPEGSVGALNNLIPLNFISIYWDQNDVVDYICDMTVKAIITIDGELQDRGNLEIAAFSGNELRGIARPKYWERPQQFITDLMIQGVGNETITFKLYDHSGNIDESAMPLVSDFTVTFEDDKILGKDGPITLNFVYQSVAKVGEEYFTTLAEAVEAATEGNNTITLLRHAEGAGVVIDKDVTIDFGGFTYTFNKGVNISIRIIAAKIVIKANKRRISNTPFIL